MSMKTALRRATGDVVSGLRLAKLVARAFGGNAAILAYHRVLDPALYDPDTVEPGMFVTRDAFATHLELLGSKYHVVPLDTLVRQLLTGEEIARRTVVLTFDDGWLDTYQTAYPLLKRAGLPATVFVPTALVGTRQRFWFSRAAEVAAEIWQRSDSLLSLNPIGPTAFVANLLAVRPSRPRFIWSVLNTLKDFPPEKRENIIDRLAELAEARLRTQRELVDWDDLRRMSVDAFEVGSHTATHVLLTEVTSAAAKIELEESRRVIAEQIGRPATSLCYPNGNHDESVRRLAKTCGFACALTTAAGFADPPIDLHALPRIGVHQDVAPKASGLELLLSGVFS